MCLAALIVCAIRSAVLVVVDAVAAVQFAGRSFTKLDAVRVRTIHAPVVVVVDTVPAALEGVFHTRWVEFLGALAGATAASNDATSDEEDGGKTRRRIGAIHGRCYRSG